MEGGEGHHYSIALVKRNQHCSGDDESAFSLYIHCLFLA